MSLLQAGIQARFNHVKNRILITVLKFLAVKVLPWVLLLVLVINIPLIVVEGIKNTFSSWFDGKENKYANTDDAVREWLDSLENNDELGYGYVTKEEILHFINAQESTFLKNIKIPVVEHITTTTTDTKNAGAEPSIVETEKVHEYELCLGESTYEYRLPWQIMLVLKMALDVEYSKKLEERLLEIFSSRFYGLLSGNLENLITENLLQSDAKYRYIKTVDIKTTKVQKYIVEKKVASRVAVKNEDGTVSYVTEKDKDGNTVYRTEKETHYRTTITESTVRYPLPYFSKIDSFSHIITFEYEESTKTTTDTSVSNDGNTTVSIIQTVTEPVLKDVVAVANPDKFVGGLSILGVDASQADIENMQSQAELLPNGEYASYLLDSVARIYINGFDFYGGAESGKGRFKLSGNGVFSWPTNGPVSISSGFGLRIHPVYKTLKMHTGIDINCNTSMRVLASLDGVVEFVGEKGGYGKTIILSHPNGLKTLYAHLSKILVKNGQNVNTNQEIGVPGSTGVSTGVHLHYEVRLEDAPCDPAQYLGLVPDIEPEDILAQQ